jgi:hypothetical protein
MEYLNRQSNSDRSQPSRLAIKNALPGADGAAHAASSGLAGSTLLPKCRGAHASAGSSLPTILVSVQNLGDVRTRMPMSFWPCMSGTTMIEMELLWQAQHNHTGS